eukprot:m.300018 g.300018  ORF g.300018 m.300018 type:complete len:171 (+) comp40791_c1_seq6:3640-4152(+)
MSAVLCAGSVFDCEALEQNGCLYGWLDSLLDCGDDKVHQLGCKTVEYLLLNNEAIKFLLEWVIDRSYTGSRLVQDGAFTALAKVFIKKDYPCQTIPVFNLVLYKTSDPVIQIREKAADIRQTLFSLFWPVSIIRLFHSNLFPKPTRFVSGISQSSPGTHPAYVFRGVSKF